MLKNSKTAAAAAAIAATADAAGASANTAGNGEYAAGWEGNNGNQPDAKRVPVAKTPRKRTTIKASVSESTGIKPVGTLPASDLGATLKMAQLLAPAVTQENVKVLPVSALVDRYVELQALAELIKEQARIEKQLKDVFTTLDGQGSLVTAKHELACAVTWQHRADTEAINKFLEAHKFTAPKVPVALRKLVVVR